MKWYVCRLSRPMRVAFVLRKRTAVYWWHRVYGLQIGGWFIGAIKGMGGLDYAGEHEADGRARVAEAEASATHAR